jgi:hypothetical protein
MPLVPLRSALDGWLPGRRPASDALSTIAAAWASIVGPAVAAHSAPIALNGKSLVVATRSSAWSQQLQFLSVTILRGLAAIALDEPVERLVFRSGSLRAPRAGSVSPGAAAPMRQGIGRELEPEPAADAGEALERVRRRVTSARRRAPSACVACGAPVDAAVVRMCAPCEGGATRARTLQLERIVYLAPWLGVEDLRQQMPELSAAEFESARRTLLQRWWLVLERCRRSGKVSGSRLERQVASSYVLLQSRLPPDRVTPAIVRNLLGDELEAMLWPGSGDKANPADSSKTIR